MLLRKVGSLSITQEINTNYAIFYDLKYILLHILIFPLFQLALVVHLILHDKVLKR
jgi:hypothetical protein